MANSKFGQIETVLREIEVTTRHIEASVVVSSQGLPICSAMPRGVDDGTVAAMTAAILSMGERATVELARGRLNRILVEGEQGYFILTGAGKNAILAVLTKREANLGMVFLVMQRASDKIKGLLD